MLYAIARCACAHHIVAMSVFEDITNFYDSAQFGLHDVPAPSFRNEAIYVGYEFPPDVELDSEDQDVSTIWSEVHKSAKEQNVDLIRKNSKSTHGKASRKEFVCRHAGTYVFNWS